MKKNKKEYKYFTPAEFTISVILVALIMFVAPILITRNSNLFLSFKNRN